MTVLLPGLLPEIGLLPFVGERPLRPSICEVVPTKPPPGPSPNDVGRITPTVPLSRPAQSRNSPSIHAPAMGYTKGLWIPLSERHNAMISMRMVGPVGLEPTTKGL